MTPLVRPLLVLLVLTALAATILGDVLVLDDGRRIEGTIVSETAKEVEIKTSFGTFKFPRSQIVEIKKGKTKDQIYKERLAACKTADDFYALGVWCEENKLKKRAEKIFARAIEVDPEHEGARLKLGFVRYKGEWMTPAERDKRQKADFAAEMAEKGLVEHEGHWVTPEEKKKLEQGLVFYEGRWMPKDEAMRAQGLAEHNGEWIAREAALAKRSIAEFVEALRNNVNSHVGQEAVLIGTIETTAMEEIDKGLVVGRRWFNEHWDVRPGLKLYNDRLAEFYVFDAESSPQYEASVDFIAERSTFIPEGWAASVKRTFGFVWIDPITTSSARQWNRDLRDLIGHCYHHFGHLMLSRHGYKGRLLPPWYEEGMAALTELRIHEENMVFCRSSVNVFEGTQSDTGREDFDDNIMRDGSWREALKKVIKQGQALPFDKLAQLEFSQLTLIDIAQSMAIVEWLEHQPNALPKFHKVLRRVAPPAPARVIRTGHERQRAYDQAFQEALGIGFRQADREWRQWFLKQ